MSHTFDIYTQEEEAQLVSMLRGEIGYELAIGIITGRELYQWGATVWLSLHYFYVSWEIRHADMEPGKYEAFHYLARYCEQYPQLWVYQRTTIQQNPVVSIPIVRSGISLLCSKIKVAWNSLWG